ncbi:maleylpyruvate isomerase N-terminal domain-containing protein [Streptomyces sp. NPDC049813]|uniref:maleylpyruvate isomerase N-terminal domain-containing protein n=1 Tax=Streptomyces sp. NPDC049813 TaxID=3365597 RepID=UPI0037AB8D98
MHAGTAEPEVVGALRDAYDGFARVVAALSEEESWLPSGCAGWAVRDLVFHCVGDAQRGLVALHTPAAGPPDRDAVTYWANWQPDTAGSLDERRWARVGASVFPRFAPLRQLYLTTAAATVTAAERGAGELRDLVGTQGHVLSAGDLLATLCVEATVHHLDLIAHLPAATPRPGAAGLAHVRRALDGLLGRAVPVDWSDEEYALAGTGRSRLTAAERHLLGADAGRFPLFG